VVKDHQLLHTARDYFQFVTKFSEVINVSATHLYHSALGLSPLSSVVRKFYYHQRPHPSPRVVIGIKDSWGPTSAIATNSYYLSSTWSPCSQFIAVAAKEAVEIWDALTLKLHSIPYLTQVTTRFRGGLAYSPDGYSLAAYSNAGMIIWDTKTGGEATRIDVDVVGDWLELVWSLDGRTICTISSLAGGHNSLSVNVYDVASGTKLSPGILHSDSYKKTYIWAYDKLFRIMVTTRGDQKNWTIDIFEVGPTLTRIQSLPLQFESLDAFSPTTYRVSTAKDHYHDTVLVILDISNSEVLLKQAGSYQYHSFSPNADFFAAFTGDHLSIWRYTSGHYIQWKEFQQTPAPLQFSPTSSSILGHAGVHLHMLHLDYSSAALAIKSVITTHNQPMDAFAPDSTYIATAYHGESTITITNLKSQNPFPTQFIDTDLEISAMILTGNILLVKSSDVIVAWLLTMDGMVDGIIGNTRADRNDSLWDMSLQNLSARWRRLFGQQNRNYDIQEFSVGDEAVSIRFGGFIIRTYHIRTGEILNPTEMPQSHRQTWYKFHNKQQDECNLYHCDLFKHQDHEWPISQATLQEGWVKDPEGKHRLWLHPSWRSSDVHWLDSVTALRLRNSPKLRAGAPEITIGSSPELAIIKF